jgi:hypothetical protein
MPFKFALALIAILTFSSDSFAFESCNEVVTGYEKSDLMYVVCPSLTILLPYEMNVVIRTILSQNTVVTDDIFVYFVATQEDVGNEKANPEHFVAYFYTHDSV